MFALCTVYALLVLSAFGLCSVVVSIYLSFGELNFSSVFPYFSVNVVQAARVSSGSLVCDCSHRILYKEHFPEAISMFSCT